MGPVEGCHALRQGGQGTGLRRAQWPDLLAATSGPFLSPHTDFPSCLFLTPLLSLLFLPSFLLCDGKHACVNAHVCGCTV